MKHGEQAPEVTFEHSDATDFEVMEHCFPWMLAGADALVEALLSELVSGVGTDSGKKGGKKTFDSENCKRYCEVV
jgi:hypothetical protein